VRIKHIVEDIQRDTKSILSKLDTRNPMCCVEFMIGRPAKDRVPFKLRSEKMDEFLDCIDEAIANHADKNGKEHLRGVTVKFEVNPVIKR